MSSAVSRHVVGMGWATIAIRACAIGHIRAVAQFGSAPALGAGCRGFKSRRPDHESLTPAWEVGLFCFCLKGRFEVEKVLLSFTGGIAVFGSFFFDQRHQLAQ